MKRSPTFKVATRAATRFAAVLAVGSLTLLFTPGAPLQAEPDVPAVSVPPALGPSPSPAEPVSESGTEPEAVEADVSTRSVAVTSSFSGTEIVIFGAIDNSRMQSKEDPIYDVIVVVEGTAEPLVARRKSRVAGIWINTKGVPFESIPSYYAIYSTRPISEIAHRRVLRNNAIGFEHVLMTPAPEDLSKEQIGPNQLAEFKAAVVRIKKQEGLYKQDQRGVEFIGKSLFRATVGLPANVPVGPLATRVYLFSQGKKLAEFDSKVTMRREGLEKILHGFAFQRPFLYGLFALFLAVASGLIASAVFQRKSG